MQQAKDASSNAVGWINSPTASKFNVNTPPQQSNESISFWREVPPFQSSLDLRDPRMSPNTFMIEKVELDDLKRKILHGRNQVAVVSGVFSDTEFQAGQQVTVLPCFCCMKQSGQTEERSAICKKDGEGDAAGFGAGKLVFHVDNQRNVILIHDDLISVTTFGTCHSCINNPVLQTRVAGFSFEFGHTNLAIGTLVHLLIQTALVNGKTAFAFLVKEAKRIIKENLLLLYSCNVSDKEALNEILKHMKNIIKLLDSGFKVKEVEHRVFSTIYGLKGNIDCLDTNFVIEIKTGKYQSLEHRSQAILYTLLLMETELRRKCKDYDEFLKECCLSLMGTPSRLDGATMTHLPLLYYVKAGDTIKINLYHEEIILLLKLRNEIACNKELVPCQCPEERLCAVMNRIKSLDPLHFLRRQLQAIELEAGRERSYFRAQKVSQEGERVRLKIAEHVLVNEYVYFYTLDHKLVTSGIVEKSETNEMVVVLREDICLEKYMLILLDNDTNFTKFITWALTQVAYPKFLKKDLQGGGVDSFQLPGQKYGLEIDGGSDLESGSCSILSGQLELDSSIELASIDLDSDFSVISEDEKIGSKTQEVPRTEHTGNAPGEFGQTYPGRMLPMNPRELNAIESTRNGSESCDEALLDLNSSSSWDFQGSPVLNVTSSSGRDRPTVLFNESQQPVPLHYFTPPLQDGDQSAKYVIPEAFRERFLELNNQQRQALFHSLNCDNYRVIHGMPGTGKSKIISLLIEILVFYKKKVLLICYTHLAIQNILRRLTNVKYYWAKKENPKFENSAEATQYFKSIELVAGTCYSFSDVIYLGRKFDFCVIDEGSQMHLLLSLIPVSVSKRFCIVGDHLQLKPLCRASNDLATSLFEYLIDDQCITLTTQYRMGDAIMRLSNSLFYDNKLVGFGGLSMVEFVDSERSSTADLVKKAKDCAILTYFNAKVRELSMLNEAVICTTIDRFQGSEHDNVIVIFEPVEKCEVMESRERLNVALTRAKKSLKLVGNRRKMLEIPLFKQLLDLLT